MSTIANIQADLDAVYSAAEEFGAETVHIGSRDVPCAVGSLTQSLDPAFMGDPRERIVKIMVKATHFSTQNPVPSEGDRVTFRNRDYRIDSIENGLGNLEYELNLIGVMK